VPSLLAGASLHAAAVLSRQAAASLHAPGTLTPAGKLTVHSSFTATAPGSLTAAARKTSVAHGSFSASAVLTARALLTRPGAAHLAAPGAVTGLAVVTRHGQGALTASPVLFASAFNRLGTAALSSGTLLAVSATAGPDLPALWAAYMTAKTFAASQWANWHMMHQAGGTDGSAGFLYGKAYEAERQADLAYEAFQAAQKRVFAGVTG
jgi:hypothetical protein